MQELTISSNPNKTDLPLKKPNWLRVKLPIGESYKHVRDLVDTHKLHTICESGNCPNMGECWGEGTATFMILGNTCTRSCGFCAVATGRPATVDWDEPQRVAEAIHLMKVKHAVVSSVVPGFNPLIASIVLYQIMDPPSLSSSRSTLVTTACFTFIRWMASATR